MDGDHTLKRHAGVTQQTLRIVFNAPAEHRVRIEAMLLKPNMVLSGKECPQQSGMAEVADATLRCMMRTVPAAVPGLVFLSGGQSDVRATEHLNAMNEGNTAPWELSFSFGRALQTLGAEGVGRSLGDIRHEDGTPHSTRLDGEQMQFIIWKSADARSAGGTGIGRDREERSAPAEQARCASRSVRGELVGEVS